MLFVMTGLFTFIHTVSTSVATNGYRILCRSFERPRCRTAREYNPITANCNPMPRQLVPCSALNFSSFVGKAYWALVISWIACALLVLIFALSAYYLIATQREMVVQEAEQSGSLKNDMSQSGTASTFVFSKSPHGPQPRYGKAQYHGMVENKYQTPNTMQYPDQLSYQPVLQPSQQPFTIHSAALSSTEI